MRPEQIQATLDEFYEDVRDDDTAADMVIMSVRFAVGQEVLDDEGDEEVFRQLLHAMLDDPRFALVYGASHWHRFTTHEELESVFREVQALPRVFEKSMPLMAWVYLPEDVPPRPEDAGEPRAYAERRKPDYTTDEGDYFVIDTPFGPRVHGPEPIEWRDRY